MASQMKKLQQSNNKTVVLTSSNTKTRVESLGDIELKYISCGDTIEFTRLLQKQLSDRDFVAEVLFQQLVNPQIGFADFQKISDDELKKLAEVFVENEKYEFKYFQNAGDFFKDFKKALEIGYEKNIEELRKTFEPIVKWAQETLNAFNKNYASVIQQAIGGTSYIRDSLQGLAGVAKQISDTQRRFAESIKPVIEQYQATAKIITESLRPQIDFWQKWTEQNRKIFDNFSNHWIGFQQKYNIAEQKAVRVLQKYKWFITPSFPMPFIFEVVNLDKKQGRQDKAVNKLFIKYFEAKNWRNLEIMVNDWENKLLFKKRYKILADCVKIVKIASKKGLNKANVILPTLITQIDGALTDYLYSKGIPWDCSYDDGVNSKTGKVVKIGRKTRFKNAKPEILSGPLDDIANYIFLNILFQKSQKGKPLATPFNFNRHKIIHGESVKYGRKDYLIRAFMVLDFIAHV
ncbi:MAG: hypothetical protein V2A65_00285 [Candidatus Omnitrophota bacterium]